MEFIVVENGIIIKHGCAKEKPENALQVPDGFPGYVGLPYAALKDDLSGPKPLSQQISEGIIDLPDGYKVNETDDEFIRMDQSEIDEKYPVKTCAAEGSFESVSVRKTFDRDGNFGYFPPSGMVEMSGEQPGKAWKAQNGQWVFDLDVGKKNRLAEVKTAFAEASVKACCLSSVGFEINADEVANRNIEGLVLALEPGESTLFRAYDNTFHDVTREELETMRREIVVNSQRLYQIKWQLEAAIAAAGTVEELEAIAITFESSEGTMGEEDGQTV